MRSLREEIAKVVRNDWDAGALRLLPEVREALKGHGRKSRDISVGGEYGHRLLTGARPHGEASVSGRAAVAALSAWALALSSLARADAMEFPVSIVEGPLASSLRALETQTGIELLYDSNVVRQLRATSVTGKLTTEAALQHMLSETDLTVRRAPSGAWIIERRTTPPLAHQDVAVAEILVVGWRTQNADIRRYEDDVLGRAGVSEAHALQRGA